MKNHPWKFFRAGGVDQVNLESAGDLKSLGDLDQKLWVALSCPTRGVEFDSKTLDIIDTDKDGRIRAPEMVAAADWAAAQLKDPAILLKGSAELPLEAINDGTDEGRQLLRSARQILANLGKPSATGISVTDTVDTAKIFAATKFNGDGVVPAASAESEKVAGVIGEMLACVGGETDRSGAPGVTQAKVDLFFAEARAFVEWQEKGLAEGVLPLGAGTAAALAAVQAVQGKVDDYFARCRLAAFDARALGALNRQESEYLALAAKDLTLGAQELAAFPLSHIEANRPLPLKEGLNPAWTAAMGVLCENAVKPLLGARTALTEADWLEMTGRLAGHRAWLAAKAGGLVEKLGLARVREILASDAQAGINQLIVQDKALEPEMNAIAAVDRLARYHRDLCRLLNNFVAFTDFYSGKRKAIFQAGTLFLDGRSCELCVKVADMGKHAALATLSRTYLTYCECTRKGSAEKMVVAAAFTGGDSDNLMVGRNGIFYDRAGQDWDATIVKVIEHPISIRQAILAPYKRIGKMIGEQIEKFAASRDKEVTDKASTGISASAKAAEAGKPGEKKDEKTAFDVAKFAGIFAAIGMAIGAIGTALAAVVTGFMGLTWWKMPLALLGVMVAISGPSVIIAWLKLRQRNLGPILDACGWAVNGRVKINIPFGAALTSVAALPPGAQRSLEDPYAEKNESGKWLALLLLILAGIAIYWYLTYFA